MAAETSSLPAASNPVVASAADELASLRAAPKPATCVAAALTASGTATR
ncbi:hypothetical protein LAUMK4_00926 [Mycobacterium persicum]|uniref:Uncharacterized protein n=1 Tax=Mycobacterium persicum TaxID=1487726 RepID=A0ABY6RDR7_9MYCO|nr:hypothetical protein LAUMK4_00926 [Mycobacterium persicum]